MTAPTFQYIEIKSYEGGEVVRRLDVTGKSGKRLDLIEAGLNRNLNHDKYYTFTFDSETKLATK